MVSVPARRQQVAYGRERGLSVRRACTLLSTQRLFAFDTMDPSRALIVRCGIRRVRQITPWNFCVPQRFG